VQAYALHGRKRPFLNAGCGERKRSEREKKKRCRKWM